MWFDTHAHPYLDADAGALERGLDAGLAGVVVVGIDEATSEQAIALADRFDRVWATVGLHPNEASAYSGALLDRLLALARHEKVVGVGETGLDRYRDRSPLHAQLESFRAHIDMAHRLNLALVVHNREAHADTYAVLESIDPLPRTVLHCFSGGPADAARFLELPVTFSFAGPLTFRNAPELREAAAVVPLDRTVVETDAPFLSPHPFRGKPNEPARVAITGAALAGVHGRPAAEVAATTTRNAKQLFRIP